MLSASKPRQDELETGTLIQQLHVFVHWFIMFNGFNTSLFSGAKACAQNSQVAEERNVSEEAHVSQELWDHTCGPLC